MNASSSTDYDRLAELSKAGDKEAQRELYERVFPELYPLAKRYMRDHGSAKDMVQDAFVKVFGALEHYKSKGMFLSWAKRILVNCCLDELRKTRMSYVNFNETYLHLEQEENNEIERNKKLFKDAEYIMKELDKLPEGLRVIFSLYAIEGYKHREIAEMLDMPEGTCKSNYKRAKDKLRKKLEENYLSEELNEQQR